MDHDGIVFLHIGSGAVFASNGIGARIWRGLLDHNGLESIAADICVEYGVPRQQVQQDVPGVDLKQVVARLNEELFALLAGGAGPRRVRLLGKWHGSSDRAGHV